MRQEQGCGDNGPQEHEIELDEGRGLKLVNSISFTVVQMYSYLEELEGYVP